MPGAGKTGISRRVLQGRVFVPTLYVGLSVGRSVGWRMVEFWFHGGSEKVAGKVGEGCRRLQGGYEMVAFWLQGLEIVIWFEEGCREVGRRLLGEQTRVGIERIQQVDSDQAKEDNERDVYGFLHHCGKPVMYRPKKDSLAMVPHRYSYTSLVLTKLPYQLSGCWTYRPMIVNKCNK
ncbi:hypothetical protein DPMN_074088 [Dreissena polymorpha]|uniref:Uncharacterized protein n=1 Tax=Dreissena polymorpha TaxID=45954 RepID=A0A9D3YEK6_DREPO|nr:hypothetical protein DPMN_074088 [Dreissena polymorpha]